MKGNTYLYTHVSWWRKPFTNRPVLSGISAAALAMLGGCATHQPTGVTCGDARPLAGPLRVRLGTIAVAPASKPATVGFDCAQGQIETFGDRASVTAARMLDPSGLSGDPAVCAVASVAGFVIAPVAAVVSGTSAARARLAPDRLSGCESNLLRAMTAMASQEHFRDRLVTAAHEKTGRRLLRLESTQTPAADCPGAESVLETQVQELRLERTGKGDTSFALRIQAQVRLVRTVDGSVLYQRPVEYRSGTCLFLDWTLSDSFQKVAQTGYREMAEQVVEQILVATPEGPLLAGAGYKKSPARRQDGAIELANRGSGRGLAVQPVSFPMVNPGAIRIYPKAAGTPVGVPAPLTKDAAAIESARDLEWTLDGLYNHPNPVISLPSIAVAIPMSLWNQAVAGVCGLTERQAREADAQLRAAVLEARPHNELADQVAQQLAPQTSQVVILEKTPLPLGEDAEYTVMRDVASVTPVGLRKGQTAAGSPAGQGTGVALEIVVVDARLAVKDGVNRPLALCVEAEARLLRADDGEQIYSCPIAYRSQPRKLKQWAAHDAQLFRQELRKCYREVSATLVEQLVSRGLVAPGGVACPALASE